MIMFNSKQILYLMIRLQKDVPIRKVKMLNKFRIHDIKWEIESE
ncbi:protein of unknown function [Candidatus Nitrosotalea okcheonensis]|uniref:Uncharacterized protein n=1 Tax=Candidatus Nitrosotalea okcheonensis TaxID=1903276 RepID=A0A2H1FG81_9ARCH|nr:protein of unknown function [Candidatus Nitrosotalea okcheonensis]